MRERVKGTSGVSISVLVESNILLSVEVFGDLRKSTHAVLWSLLWTRARRQRSTCRNTRAHTRTHIHTLICVGRLANDSHKLNGLSSVVFDSIGTQARGNVPNDAHDRRYWGYLIWESSENRPTHFADIIIIIIHKYFEQNSLYANP